MVVGEVGVDSLRVLAVEKTSNVVGTDAVLVAEPHEQRAGIQDLGRLALALDGFGGCLAVVRYCLQNVVENLAFHGIWG